MQSQRRVRPVRSNDGCEFQAVDGVREISCLAAGLPLQVHKPKSIPVSRFHVKKRSLSRLACVASCVVLVTSLAERLCAQTTNTAAADIVVTETEGKVEVLRSG